MHIGARTRFMCQPPILLRFCARTRTQGHHSHSRLDCAGVRHAHTSPTRTTGPNRVPRTTPRDPRSSSCIGSQSHDDSLRQNKCFSIRSCRALGPTRAHHRVSHSNRGKRRNTRTHIYTHTTGHERSEARARSVGKGGHVDACTPEVHMGQQPRPYTAPFSRSDQKT